MDVNNRFVSLSSLSIFGIREQSNKVSASFIAQPIQVYYSIKVERTTQTSSYINL